jgi:tRNA(Ile)-lysidine synthase TilS/MesJ
MDNLNAFTGLVRRCVDDYGMINSGDRIAVGVSGGKDSLVLLLAIRHLQSYYPKRFELEAVTADLGFEGMDFTKVAALCAELEIPYTLQKTDIREIVFDLRKEDNPCSLCAKMRRGALNQLILSRGCGKLALGHHFDDAVETFLLSLVFEGRVSCFKPVTYMSRAGVWQIRPLLYAGEKRIAALAAAMELPVVENPCPQDRGSKRYEVKELTESLCLRYPGLKSKIFGAMQRLPLDGWAPKQDNI